MAERRLLKKKRREAQAAPLGPQLQEIMSMFEQRKRARGMSPAERSALAKDSLARSGSQRARRAGPSNFERIMASPAAGAASGRRGTKARAKAGLKGPQRSAFDEGSLANRTGRVNLSKEERNENRFLAEFGKVGKGKRRRG